MLTQDEIQQLREVIREEVQAETEPIKKNIAALEIRMREVIKQENAALETRLDKKIDDTIDAAQKEILKKIDTSQEDTIKVLSDVINEGYNNHENRLQTVENILQIDKN